LNQESGNNAREVILVKENVVVSWLARAEQACVAVKVIVGFDWAHDIGVYDRARAAVPLPVTVAMGPREEGYFVFLGDDNKCNRGVEIQSRTCVCGLAVVRRRGRSLGVRTRGKGEKETGRTSNEIELFIDNCSEFSFRDAILGNIRHVGTGYRTKNPELLTAIE
jgi:hypothetical protein